MASILRFKKKSLSNAITVVEFLRNFSKQITLLQFKFDRFTYSHQPGRPSFVRFP